MGARYYNEFQHGRISEITEPLLGACTMRVTVYLVGDIVLVISCWILFCFCVADWVAQIALSLRLAQPRRTASRGLSSSRTL